MKRSVRLILATAILLGAGVARLPVEAALTRDFRKAGLLDEPLPLPVKEKIGQTGIAVSLGGLRTLLASFAHLRAYDQFAGQQWAELEKSVDTTVELAPHSRYYWDIGAWHMAYNAGSYYWTESSLPPLRARAERQRWIHKGRDFLERGTVFNSRNPLFYQSLADLYSNPFQGPDDVKATAALRKALDLGADMPSLKKDYVLSLARDGSDPARALQLLDELLVDPRNRLPTFLSLKVALDKKLHPANSPLENALRLFGSEDRALRNLGNYYTSVRERLPLDGVEEVVRILEARRGVSPENPRSYITGRQTLLQDLLR